MVDVRNRISHRYFDLDYDIVWGVITEEIPKLVPKLQAVLDGLDPDQP